ncbi:MAG: glycosyltransferase family 2 protein [Frankia sp.]
MATSVPHVTFPQPDVPAPVDVVLPCLDEAGALPWVLSRLPAGYRAIVADNGSRDGSAELARGLGATVVAATPRGFGAAVHAGLLAATADVVCICDADGSLDLAQLPRLVARLERPADRPGSSPAAGADLVLGRRRPTGRGAWPAHARLANAVLARKLRRRGGARLHDLGPMRAAHRVPLLGLGIVDRRFGYPLEMLVRAAEAGWRSPDTYVEYPQGYAVSKVSGIMGGTVLTVRYRSAVLAR